MLFFDWFPPTGVEASAAQNAPVTKTCSQCGAVLPSQIRVCSFCESSFLTTNDTASVAAANSSKERASGQQDLNWRHELAHRVESYRTRRNGVVSNSAQTHLPFTEQTSSPSEVALQSVEGTHPPLRPGDDDFSFTIAIGRCSGSKAAEDSQFLIDLTAPPDDLPQADPKVQPPIQRENANTTMYPVAPIEERRLAAVIDAACLLFACGGFLALFGSLGGHFTLSKLSATVYSIAFAIVYLQYFSLFTVFGGTTPGMMLRGLQVVDFSGEQPTPRQLVIRATGYLLSAGTLFLGFVWAMWDEDSLTWHDRLSHTYLSSVDTLADAQMSGTAPLP